MLACRLRTRYNQSMTPTASIKGHFDGRSIVLDEPASLAVGQEVRVFIEPIPAPDHDESQKRTDDELAEWLEIETHKMRGVPYPPER